MPSRVVEERYKTNAERLRSMVDSGSPDIVRDAVVGDAVSGARRQYPLPRIGYRSGQLTVTGYIKNIRGGVSSIIVSCICGRPEYTVDVHNFRLFKSTRCGICARAAGEASRKKYWGYADILPDLDHRQRLLNRIASCIGRCHTETNAQYYQYGGRGIRVHEPWRTDRGAFLRYLLALDNWDDPTREIDRIDNNRGYEPGNLRFATRKENMRNRRSVAALQKEIDDLRSRLCRAEESLHNLDGTRPDHST